MKITIYTTPACPWCKKAKEWLRRRRYKFTEYDLKEDDRCRDELLKKTHQLAVPVIEIDGEIIIGFDEEKISKAIEKAKGKNL